MQNFKVLKSRYYVDVDETDLEYPYNAVDVKTNEIVWKFEFEDDALEWTTKQNNSPTFGDDEIPNFLRGINLLNTSVV